MKNKKAIIKYFTLTDEMRKNEKLDWFRENRLKDIPFETIKPDKNNNWINLTDNDFDELLPVALPKLSGKKNSIDEFSIFDLASFGSVSARDEWVYDFCFDELEKKLNYYIKVYNTKRITIERPLKKDWYNSLGKEIKWSQDIRKYIERNIEINLNNKKITKGYYRPFVKKQFYYSKELNWSLYRLPLIFDNVEEYSNKTILFSGIANNKPFSSLATNMPHCYDTLSKTQCLALHRYDKSGNRIENITDWGLKQFTEHYANVQTLQENVQTLQENVQTLQENVQTLHATSQQITKEDIFHYTYGVLHNPAYRKKYELNLKREFPRLPFYKDFYKWVNWGKELMDLHINYETIEPYSTVQTLQGNVQTLHATSQPATSQPATSQQTPKAKLKRNKETNEIILDENTSIKGIPKIAFDYKLGNRSAIDWILDQYKEKKPRDKTIAEKFNTYKFADYKETVIDLIRRVTTVSVKTMEIVNKMEAEELHNDKEKRNKKT